ncbi:MarR family winged helix-turn-helix transcriptional regulator [Methylobacterium gossipiicola]|uniref:MarR family winged helix-turn-helix transcriptional regulator n=1 Tax=Methylobacterium gossipiicola TaxID=582675 RepID=UPI001AEC734C|nr:MarR family winged helix-turn-helix transcriptional regulator [Methylobacterium gossipiicola]
MLGVVATDGFVRSLQIHSCTFVDHQIPSSEVAKLIRIIRHARLTGNIKRPDGKWIDLMSPQALQITLEVAQHPGITMKELMDASGIALGSVSRNLMALGEWHRSDMPGLGLIEAVDDPREYRRKAAFLTKKGCKFVSDLVSIQTGERVSVLAPSAREWASSIATI